MTQSSVLLDGREWIVYHDSLGNEKRQALVKKKGDLAGEVSLVRCRRMDLNHHERKLTTP